MINLWFSTEIYWFYENVKKNIKFMKTPDEINYFSISYRKILNLWKRGMKTNYFSIGVENILFSRKYAKKRRIYENAGWKLQIYVSIKNILIFWKRGIIFSIPVSLTSLSCVETIFDLNFCAESAEILLCNPLYRSCLRHCMPPIRVGNYKCSELNTLT